MKKLSYRKILVEEKFITVGFLCITVGLLCYTCKAHIVPDPLCSEKAPDKSEKRMSGVKVLTRFKSFL